MPIHSFKPYITVVRRHLLSSEYIMSTYIGIDIIKVMLTYRQLIYMYIMSAYFAVDIVKVMLPAPAAKHS
jgi:hypothetical protein